MIKRAFDIMCSIFALIIASPLLGIIAVVVKLSSPGPIIFSQLRVGKNCELFTIYKFRTMFDGSSGPDSYVLENDARVTSTGRFLRSTHLDELPQLWNILRGEMSFVGPRPIPIKETERRMREIPGYVQRFAVKPGLTGLTQVQSRARVLKRGIGRYVRLEVFYIKHQNLFLDLLIIFRGIMAAIRREGI